MEEEQEEELLLLLHTCRKMCVCVCVFTSGFMFSGGTPRTLPDVDAPTHRRVVPNTHTGVCFPGINQKLGLYRRININFYVPKSERFIRRKIR